MVVFIPLVKIKSQNPKNYKFIAVLMQYKTVSYTIIYKQKIPTQPDTVEQPLNEF